MGVEDEAVEDQVLDGTEEVIEEEAPFALPDDFADQVKSWDVPLDALPQAVALHKQLQTEEGVIDTWIRTGQALGFGLKDMERLLADDQPITAPTAAPAPVAEPEDPDRLMTAAEVSALMERERNERVQSEQQRQQQFEEGRRQAVGGAMQQFFASKGVNDVETQQFIAGFGNKYLTAAQNNNIDPQTAVATLEKAYVDYETYLEKQAQAYIAKKGGHLKAQPTAIGGGSTNAGDAEEAPDYAALGQNALDTAKARVRKRLQEQMG